MRMKYILSPIFVFLFFNTLQVSQAQTLLSGVINRYAKVIEVDSCKNELFVDSAYGFSVGDTALLIQMQGPTADSLSQENGDFIPFNAGQCEFITVSNITDNRIRLEEYLLFKYDTRFPVQLVSIVYAHGDCQIVDT